MEKRVVIFILLSIPILFGYQLLVNYYFPQEEEIAQEEIAEEDAELPKKTASDEKPGDEKTGDEKKPADEPAASEQEKQPEADEAPEAVPEPTYVTLGSLDPKSDYRMLATINSRGATLERAELSPLIDDRRQFDIESDAAYIGHLAWSTSRSPEGLKVNVVGDGTPAALAKPDTASIGLGLKPGDVLVSLDGKRIATLGNLNEQLKRLKPGAVVKLEVNRPSGGEEKSRLQIFTVALGKRPVNVVRPEPAADQVQPANLSEYDGANPYSFLLDLATLGGKDAPARVGKILREEPWRIETSKANESVEFRKRLRGGKATGLAPGVDLEFVKRYRIAKAAPAVASAPGVGLSQAYHLVMDIEIVNLGKEAQKLSFRLRGPTSMTREGWWYSNKKSPGWSGAGARDIVYRTEGAGFNLLSASKIYSIAKKAQEYEDDDESAEAEKKLAELSLFVKSDDLERRQLNYVSVDTQYFACAVLPGKLLTKEPSADRPHETFGAMRAMNLQAADDETLVPRRGDITFELTSTQEKIEPKAKLEQSLVVFIGPKDPPVLADYGLREIVYYGWFGWVSRPLLWILHFFHSIIPNYAIAIIMLTVLVRGCLLPISMKTAKNAAQMQALAPEMKKIAEKYKTDMQKRSEAQRELFAKHKYNPLGGCWMMFIQFPIFLGLYSGLSMDIDLRGQPLIPGVEWASNLAAPDMLVYWGDWPFLPDFLVGENGYLGPYLNLLPLITVGLFLWQQKLFAPPATDEQTRMQLKVMNYMTVFMGVMFFRVPAGLCIYFITSSLWGITERKMLKKINTKGTGGQPAKVVSASPKPAPKPAPQSKNGASGKTAGQKEKRK